MNDIQTMFDPKLNELIQIRGLLANIAGDMSAIRIQLEKTDNQCQDVAEAAFNSMFSGCTPDDLPHIVSEETLDVIRRSIEERNKNPKRMREWLEDFAERTEDQFK